MSAVLRFKSLRTIACEGYRNKFRLFFGDQVTVTPEICEAVARDFPWAGAACRLLTDKLERRFSRKRCGWYEPHSVWQVEHPVDYEENDRRLKLLRIQDARLFAELFNSPENATKRAALTRLARK